MRNSYKAATMIAATAFGGIRARPLEGWCGEPAPPVARPRDPAAEATAVRAVPADRPEQSSPNTTVPRRSIRRSRPRSTRR